MLEVLWELAHLPTLPTTLVQQALEEHLTILSDAYAVKETVKRNYIIKCIEDIKKVSWYHNSHKPQTPKTIAHFTCSVWTELDKLPTWIWFIFHDFTIICCSVIMESHCLACFWWSELEWGSLTLTHISCTTPSALCSFLKMLLPDNPYSEDYGP